MPIELTTIPIKRFLLFILAGLLVTLSLSVGLAIRTGTEERETDGLTKFSMVKILILSGFIQVSQIKTINA